MKINKLYLPIVLSIVLVGGVLIGKYLNQYPTENYNFLYSQSNKIDRIINYIETKYVDSIDRDELI